MVSVILEFHSFTLSPLEVRAMKRTPLISVTSFILICCVLYGPAWSRDLCGGFVGIGCPSVDDFCEFPPGACNIADNQGVCVDTPDACPLVWDPVCGCDGVTYGNDCDRQMARISKEHDGPCVQVCQDNSECGSGEYCAKDPSVCDNGAGICEVQPQICPEIYDPVCGCDGNTYRNACDAASAGVNIASEGECPQVCGGFAGIPCHGPDQFCEFPPGTCNFADQFGGCVVIPEACPDVWNPVCGCDGITYSNDCGRRAAQVSKAHDGPCCPVAILCASGYIPVDTDGDGCDDACMKPCVTFCDCLGLDLDDPCPLLCPNCGNFWTCDEGLCEENCGQIPPDYHTTCKKIICQDNSDCLSSGQYCAKVPGVCDNGTGICESRPLGCPDVWDPVCGCDGKTYSNSCAAMAVGVNVAHPGECLPDCDPCLDNDDCGDSEFCLKIPGKCKRAGVCQPKPQHCPLFFDPVCGCDGRIYSNGCDAHANGASIAHKGPCVHPMCVDRPLMDYNGDCRVTMIDFAVFANHWFDCGMVPANACWQ